MKPKMAVIVAVVFVAALAGLVFISRSMGSQYQFLGSTIDPPVNAPDFTLARADGEIFRLSEQTGNVVLIFFGYTHCPDICPTTLADFKVMHNELGTDASHVKFVYITVDPERDTAEVINRYATAFNPEFIGLTGDPAVLEEIYRVYGVFHEKQEGQTADGYLVAHTSVVYVIDKNGSWRLTFPFEMSPYDMVEDVRYLLSE